MAATATVPDLHAICWTNAWLNCSHCHGAGWDNQRVCACVHRNIFRQCYQRWREHKDTRPPGRSSLHLGLGWSLPRAEYAAEFELAVLRALSPAELAVWRSFVGRRKRTAHPMQLARVKEKIGRALLERGLFPAAGYFAPEIERRQVGKTHEVYYP